MKSIFIGCPVCGSRNMKKVSGFMICECGNKSGDGGLGRETERRDSNGTLYNVADHRLGVVRLPGADEQVKTPKVRGRPYFGELK